MMRARKIGLYLWALGLILTMAPAWGQSVPSVTVKEVQHRVDGEIITAPAQQDRLDAKTFVEPGAPLSRYDVRRSIEALYTTGEYADLQAVKIPLPDGVRILFDLTRKTSIGRIQFTGSRFDRQTLLDAIHSRPGDEYLPTMAEADRHRLLALYHRHGYYQATVEFEPPSAAKPGETVPLTYRITEGNPVAIRSIQFSGADSIDTDRLKEEVRSKKGEPYRRELAEADARRLRLLYRSRGFLTVKVAVNTEYNIESRTLSLLFQITEGTRAVVELPDEEVDPEQLRKRLPLFKQESYSELILASTASQIQRIYEQKGYTEARVTYEVEQKSEDEILIRFKADLGKAQRIRRIVFEGNEAFEAETLRDQMETQSRSFFAIPGLRWLFPEGIYEPETIEKDRRALEIFYRKGGYPDAQVTIEREVTERNQLTLHVRIKEGEQREINRVSTQANTVLSQEELAKLAAKSGKPYSRDIVTQDLFYLRSLYDAKGYLHAQIEPSYQADSGVLTYQITEGPQVTFGNIRFHGNRGVKREVLQREFERLGISRGKVFDPETLSRAQQRLFRLGLFRTVNIETPGRFEANTAEVDVVVRVEMRKPGSVSVSAGYSPSEGYRGSAGLTHHNLFKRNMLASGDFSLGTRGNVYEARLTEPWLKLPAVGATISTLRLFEDNLEEQDEVRARGGTASIARRLGEYSNVALQYKYQELRQKLPDEPEQQTRVSSLGLSYHRDSRDNFLNPTSGWLNEAGVEYTGGFLGGETSFFKFTTDHRRYWPIRDGFVLASAVRFGFEEGLRQNRRDEIISFERFRAGGATTVRGYGERSLGPLDESGNHRGDVLLLLNTEMRITIYKILGVAFFFDTGNVWDSFSTVDESPLHSAVGFGPRIDTPVGPIRFDIAFPLREGDESPLYWLQLGQAY